MGTALVAALRCNQWKAHHEFPHNRFPKSYIITNRNTNTILSHFFLFPSCLYHSHLLLISKQKPAFKNICPFMIYNLYLSYFSLFLYLFDLFSCIICLQFLNSDATTDCITLKFLTLRKKNLLHIPRYVSYML